LSASLVLSSVYNPKYDFIGADGGVGQDGVIGSPELTAIAMCREKGIHGILDNGIKCRITDVNDDGEVTVADWKLINDYRIAYERQLGINNIRGQKLMSKYSPKEVFLISDKNWQEVLSLVPVTTWTDSSINIKKYPTLIYHEEYSNPIKKIKFEKDPAKARVYIYIFNERQINPPQIGEEFKVTVKIGSYAEGPDGIGGNKGSGGEGVYLNSFAIKYPSELLRLEPKSDTVIVNKVIPPKEQLTYEFKFKLIAEPPKAIDADSIIHFLQQYKPDKATLINNAPQELKNLLIAAPGLGAGLTPTQVKTINVNDYFSYWDSFNTIVYVENNYELALMASTYASLLNVPLIIQGTPINTINVFSNKNVVCVGNIISKSLRTFCNEQYNLEQLQRRYLELTNTDKVILVNPEDISQRLSVVFDVEVADLRGTIQEAFNTETEFTIDEFVPQKSNKPIEILMNVLSLSSPILAASKHELIIPITKEKVDIPLTCDRFDSYNKELLNSFDYFRQQLNKKMSLLNIKPKYLTIIAAPIAIPDSELKGYESEQLPDMNVCNNVNSGRQYRRPLDWRYGSSDKVTPNMIVGRIYGVTSSDVSSYIARSVFYNQLFSETYPQNQYGLLAIGNSRNSYQFESSKLTNIAKDNLINTICYNSVQHKYRGEYRSWPLRNCVDKIKADLDDYQNKQLVFFLDHSTSVGWRHTLFSLEIPWLDLPVVLSKACSPNNFWEGKEYTFGMHLLRKGAMAFYGGIGLTNGIELASQEYYECMASDPLTDPSCYLPKLPTSKLFNLITTTDQSSGEMYNSMLNDRELNPLDFYYYKNLHMLLGDPTLIPNFKKFKWTDDIIKDPVKSDLFVSQPCNDGTEFLTCSKNKPKFCTFDWEYTNNELFNLIDRPSGRDWIEGNFDDCGDE